MSGLSQADFTALQATVLALQQQLLAAQAPAPAASPVPKAATPDEYDGKSNQLEPFIHQCNLFLKLDNYTDRKKITFVLTYMKKGSALTWAEQKLTEYAAANWTKTFTEFLTEL